MKFVANGVEDSQIHLTLEPKGHGSDEVFLMANGNVIMGFYEGKYRLYSGGSNLKGLCINSSSLIQCHNYAMVT